MRGGVTRPPGDRHEPLGDACWRVLSDGPGDGAWNMAVDDAIARAVGARRAPSTIRFYAWRRPTVSLGYLQATRGAVERQACDELGVGAVRRPTGGRSVLHDDELTYSVCVPLDPFWTRLTVVESFCLVSEGIMVGLRSLGISGILAGATGSPALRSDACFQLPRMPAILVAGDKLVGSAQRRYAGSILQHGSLLLGLNVAMHQRVFPGWPRVNPDRGVTWLKAILRPPPTRAEIERALWNGWMAVFGVCGKAGTLTSAERRVAERLVTTRYGRATWTWRR